MKNFIIIAFLLLISCGNFLTYESERVYFEDIQGTWALNHERVTHENPIDGHLYSDYKEFWVFEGGMVYGYVEEYFFDTDGIVIGYQFTNRYIGDI